jgi:DNA polymerase
LDVKDEANIRRDDMTQDQHPHVVRIKRGLLQRLESLELAGVSHLKKSPAIKAKIPVQAAPAPVPRQAVGSAVSGVAPQKTVARPNAPVANPARTKLPFLEIIEQLEQSPDERCRALAAVARDVSSCRRCAELAETRTQTVFGSGNPHAKLVFCGEAPGADEDKQGKPFVGRAGQLLTDIIEKGMKIRREDVYILNILRCRPPGNRNPSPFEAANCREYLERQLQIIQPEFICCLGTIAAQNLLQTDTSIGRLRGIIHDLDGIKVLCTYHPAYLLRNPEAKRYVWDDIQILMREMGMGK